MECKVHAKNEFSLQEQAILEEFRRVSVHESETEDSLEKKRRFLFSLPLL